MATAAAAAKHGACAMRTRLTAALTPGASISANAKPGTGLR